MGILGLFCAIMGGGAIYELHKICVRLDNGQQVPPVVATVTAPDGQIEMAAVYGVEWQFMWLPILIAPQADQVPIVHPVIVIHLDENGPHLSIANNAGWLQRNVSDVFPEDANGVPLVSWYTSPPGVPVTILVSTNLTDWDTLATVNVDTDASFVDVDRDWNNGQAFYEIQ